MGGAEYLWLESLFTLFIRSRKAAVNYRSYSEFSLMLDPNRGGKREEKEGRRKE